MIFDTSYKKPKLFDVLAAGAVTLAAVVAFYAAGHGAYALPSALLIDCFIVYAIVRLVVAFTGQLRYNPYSYNTIYYLGFALFSLSVLITNVILTVRIIRFPDTYGSIDQTVFALLGSARNYMLLSAPFVLAFSVALSVSNVSLIRHERFRPVNALGIVLSVLLVAGEVFLFFADRYASDSQFEVMMHDIFVNLFAAAYLYVECMIIGTIAANVIVTRHEPARDADYIVILGCGLRKDGTPTPILQGRIDRAIAFREKQIAEGGKDPLFITSGGKGTAEINSESRSMKNYLLSKGVPGDRIIEEDRSTTTLENMRFSKAKIEERGGGGKIVYATSGYHVFRSGIWARRAKMRAQGIGAKTKWYFWPNASVREFAGLLIEHRLKQAIILGSMIAFYVVLTLIAYR